jgi:hypothetical protein
MYTNLGRTSQETHYVSSAGSSRLILFWETVAVQRENYAKHINTVARVQNFSYVKAGSTYSKQQDLKD